MNRLQIVAVLYAKHLPAVALKALGHILGEGQIELAIQRDIVRIVKYDQFAKLQMTGKRCGLRRDPFHQVAVTANCISIMIDHAVLVTVIYGSQMSFRHGHPYGHTETLSKRACGGIHTRRVAHFRVTRSLAAPLPEILQLFHRQIVSAQVQ
ncbi:Uncharacterised protein [Mycobacterium tuberculosis]|nr:Uncharacterised protein [Mycobacterium tuberculosis]